MGEKVKGLAQLIAVILFIAGSFTVSAMLQTSNAPEREKTAADRALYVDTKTISPAPYRITFETTGTVNSRADINIVPQVSGRVIEINDDMFEGGTFKKDEVLFKIDPRDYELEVERLEAAVASAKTALDITKAESEAAISEWDILHKGKDVPDLVARRPQLAEAETNLKSAKAQLNTARLNLERTTYSLPFDGRVLSGNLEIGQYVAAGQSYGTVFDLGGLEIRASLEDQKLEWLMNTEQPDITIKTRYLGQERIYKGILKRKAASLDSNTRFATIAFGFENPVTDVVPGVFTTIEIKGPTEKNIISVPAEALQKEGVIWTVNNEDTLHAITPDILFSDNDHIALKNINHPISVVISRISGAADGMKVVTESEGQ